MKITFYIDHQGDIRKAAATELKVLSDEYAGDSYEIVVRPLDENMERTYSSSGATLEICIREMISRIKYESDWYEEENERST